MTVPAAWSDEAASARVDVAGASVPAHFGDPEGEYDAARHGAALMHRPARTVVRFAGEDRARFLQGLLTSDVASLQPGDGCRALFLDNKGHVRGILDLWAAADALFTGCSPRFVDEALPDLTRYILAADVQVRDQRHETTVLAMVGPGADDALRRAELAPPATTSHGHVDGELGGIPVRLARTPDLGVAGVEVHAPADAVDTVWEALAAVLDGEGADRIGWQVAEALRIESGVPRDGHEATGAEFPQELRLDDAVDFEKGCYLGQETVARIHYRGQVNRLLSGLRSDEPLPAGAELLSSERAVGSVTSAARSPALGAVALGLVRREEAEAGATVQVRCGDEAVGTARIVDLPIDD